MPDLARARRRSFRTPQMVLGLGLFGPFSSQTEPLLVVVLRHTASVLPAWHRSVCEDLADLVQELAEEQESWLLLAASHGRQVYNRGQEKTQLHLLALTWLLDLLQFPGRCQLVTELFWGFPFLCWGPSRLARVGHRDPTRNTRDLCPGRTLQQQTGNTFGQLRRLSVPVNTRRPCSRRF